MQAGDEITLECGELVAGGDGLARLGGMPVFVPNMFPGDIALVRLHEVKKGFARGELVRLERPGPWRRSEPCPVAGECGGCDWTALRLDKQLEAKKRILSESLRRIGKIDPASLPEIAVHPSPLNYRLRSRLQRDAGATGFYAMRSHRVVPLPEQCEVVGLATARAVARGQIEPPEGVSIWEVDGELLTAGSEITVTAATFSWRLSTSSFFQVNRHLLETMLRLVSAHAGRVRSRRRALDLYAGVGFFTSPLATLFERVVAVEGSAEAARYARLNVPQNVEVIEALVEVRARKLPEADLVFLDPPRAGARPEVIAACAEKAREMVCYLSCDPVTFSRDANQLIASGWRLSTLDLLDLFPNTHHVETLSSFERAG